MIEPLWRYSLDAVVAKVPLTGNHPRPHPLVTVVELAIIDY
jgi:hypothetical protein